MEEQLTGRWVQTYFSENGAELSNHDLGQNLISEFKDGEFNVRTANDELVLQGTYRIHPHANPPAIDWTDTMGDDQGKTFLAIYELSQNSFVFSASDEGMERPLSFEPFKGHTIRKFHRAEQNA